MKKHLRKRLPRYLTRLLCLQRTNVRGGILSGLLLFVIAASVRLCAGSPYRSYLLYHSFGNRPPLAVLTLTDLLLIFAMGFACGLILGDRRQQFREYKYRAGMFFVILFTLYMTVWLLLLRCAIPWIAMVVLTAALILSLWCTVLFGTIRRLCGFFAFTFSCWVTYLFILLLGCLLRF